jgi:hypothetical protein
MKIAVLGWGSLIWDIREFNNYIGEWKKSNLKLPIEFSRISSSRDGALTLVVDQTNGVDVNVRYALFKSVSLKKGIEVLKIREGTSLKNIGYVDLINNNQNSHSLEIAEKIKNWAKENNLDAVIWTDLQSNYEEKLGRKFKAEDAYEYLKSLPLNVEKEAFEYINNAPEEVETPFRKIVKMKENERKQKD